MTWKFDARLGIALDSGKRSAAEGMIYTVETIALQQDIGFLAAVAGAEGYLPVDGVYASVAMGAARRFPCAGPNCPTPISASSKKPAGSA